MDPSLKLPRVQFRSTSRGRPKTSTSVPKRHNLAKLPPLPRVSPSRSVIDRLATPKAPNPHHLPDKPSVYWLDYIIDPTPHKIRDPKKLASYYEDFEPRFPRTRLLSAPKLAYDGEEESQTSPNVPLSALTYEATERIKDLSRPRTSVPSRMKAEEETDAINNGNMPASKLSLPPIRPLSSASTEGKPNSAKERSFGPQRRKADFSRDDFSSRTKMSHTDHGSAKSKRKTIRTARSSDDNANQ